MKLKSNVVNLLVGTAIGAVAVLTIAAASTETFSSGRFQLLASDGYLFKIDTATGQVWQSYINGTSKEFMRPNIKTSENTPTNSTPSLEKGAGK